MNRTRHLLRTAALLVAFLLTPRHVAADARVRVDSTFSTSPNDPTGGTVTGGHVDIGSTRFTNVTDPSKRIATGAKVISVPTVSLRFGNGTELRVGFITVTTPLTGASVTCAPNSRAGNASFDFSAATLNPSGSTDYEVMVRLVPIGAEDLVGGVSCAANGGGGTGAVVLKSGAAIADPPLVTASGATAVVTAKKFVLPPASVSKGLKVRYLFTVQQAGATSRFLLQASGRTVKKSKKPTVTFKGVPPGSYSVSYRAQAVGSGKVKFQTKESPSQGFSLP